MRAKPEATPSPLRAVERPASQDEATLLRRVAAGDLRAFESLYRAYHPPLSRFLLNMTRRPQLVEEVLNDTLFVVWNRPESFVGRSKLSTWIFGIAYRKALKAMRRQDQPIADETLETRPGAEIPADERIELGYRFETGDIENWRYRGLATTHVVTAAAANLPAVVVLDSGPRDYRVHMATVTVHWTF